MFAGSTGRGEANIKVCGAFLAVEFMRQGMSPEAALVKVMERVLALTEPRLLDARGRPYFDLNFYAVSKDGRTAGASAYQGARYAVADAAGARQDRFSRSEVKFVATVDVAAVRALADAAAKRYRELDTRLQQLNWTTDLI